MVCGFQYTFIHTKHFQFIAYKCASLHQQIFLARSYLPTKPLTKPFSKFFMSLPKYDLFLRWPSTSACKHIKPKSTLFTRLFPTVSHQLHCNVHVDMQHTLLQTSNTVYIKSVQYGSEILATNFAFFTFNLNSGIHVNDVIMCHTIIPHVATQRTSTTIQHICPTVITPLQQGCIP